LFLFPIGYDEVPTIVATGAAIGDIVSYLPTFIGRIGKQVGCLAAVDALDRIRNFHSPEPSHIEPWQAIRTPS
jgi:hypothetical protein